MLDFIALVGPWSHDTEWAIDFTGSLPSHLTRWGSIEFARSVPLEIGHSYVLQVDRLPKGVVVQSTVSSSTTTGLVSGNACSTRRFSAARSTLPSTSREILSLPPS